MSLGDRITCSAVGPPPPTVTWRRHGKDLTSGFASATLQINGVLDEGAYLCYAENQFGTDKKQVDVLLDSVRFVDRPPKNLHLELGQEAFVHCTAAAGAAFVNTTWHWIHKCLGCGKQPLALSNGTLKFFPTVTWMGGMYTCIAAANGVTLTADVQVQVGNQSHYKGKWVLQRF